MRSSLRISSWWAIRSSPTSLPVLALGGAGVHIPYQYTWGHERTEPPQAEPGRLFQAASLGDLPGIVERWR